MQEYDKLIPVSRPSIGKEELQEVRKVFESGWLGLGGWVFKFEEELKRILGAENVIAVSTGTHALHLALDAAGIKPGDEVIVPSFTFVASVQAIMMCGAKPVFCDINEDDLNMDAEDAIKRITPQTKAIMPVHYAGQPADMDVIMEVSSSRKIRVIEDAAHAFGSYYKDKKIGSFADLTCFSFDPIKNITCGEGGAIVTSDKEIAELIYKKRILGIDKDTWSRYEHKRDWFYDVTTLGFRYHMSNINAAIGIAQIKKLKRFIARKKEIVRKYDVEFQKIKAIKLLKRDYESCAPFHYVIRVKEDREGLRQFLKERKIDSGVHYIPNHLQPFFSKFKVELPVTEKIWNEILTLPLYYDMLDEDVAQVIKAVKDFF